MVGSALSLAAAGVAAAALPLFAIWAWRSRSIRAVSRLWWLLPIEMVTALAVVLSEGAPLPSVRAVGSALLIAASSAAVGVYWAAMRSRGPSAGVDGEPSPRACVDPVACDDCPVRPLCSHPNQEQP